MPSSRPYQVGDRVWLVYGGGYSQPNPIPGTVTRTIPADPRGTGQLQDEIEVRLDDGRRCGGPLGYFRQIPAGLGSATSLGGRCSTGGHHA